MRWVVGKEDPFELGSKASLEYLYKGWKGKICWGFKLIHMGKEDPVELVFPRLSKQIQNIYTQDERARFAEGLS